MWGVLHEFEPISSGLNNTINSYKVQDMTFHRNTCNFLRNYGNQKYFTNSIKKLGKFGVQNATSVLTQVLSTVFVTEASRYQLNRYFSDEGVPIYSFLNVLLTGAFRISIKRLTGEGIFAHPTPTPPTHPLHISITIGRNYKSERRSVDVGNLLMETQFC